jgi:cholesterol transport system auxiliary component
MTMSRLIPLSIALLALAGCAGIKYPNYYTLNMPTPVLPSHDTATISGTVLVQEFSAPAYLRRGPIVFRPEPAQIAFYNFHHWAEDPRKTVTAAMVRDLRQTFQSAELYDGRGDAEFLLTGSLDHLEELDDGKSVSVDIGISASLRNMKTGGVIWSSSSSKTSAVEQRSVAGVVAVMSRELTEATGQLVASLRSELARSAER